MSFSVVNLTSFISDGAGIAAWRIHQSLAAYGLDTKVVISNTFEQPHLGTFQAPRLSLPAIRRIQSRLKIFPTQAERWALQLRHLDDSMSTSYELFSLPFSTYAPERLELVASADVVHLHWISGLIDFTRFFKNVVKPIVWTLHDQQPYLGGFHYEADQTANLAMAGLESACFKLKQDALNGHQLAVVGNSVWNTKLARESGMFPASTSFQTIYYPLDTQKYSPRDQTSARLGLGLPTDTFIVGFAATSLENKRKGLVDLLDALRLFSPDEHPLMLLSFGRAPSADLIASMPHPWVHLGYLNDDRIKALVYSAIDCFVAPSHAEAFGQTAIEALACETPVIASRTGGLIEAVGGAGLLYEPGDVKGLFCALSQLVLSPNQCASLGSLGRALVQERHEPSSCALSYLRVYEELFSI